MNHICEGPPSSSDKLLFVLQGTPGDLILRSLPWFPSARSVTGTDVPSASSHSALSIAQSLHRSLSMYFLFLCYSLLSWVLTTWLRAQEMLLQVLRQRVCAACSVARPQWLSETLRTAVQQAPLSMDFPGKSTGVGCHFLLQGLYLTQGSNTHPLRLLHWEAGRFFTTEPPGKPSY